MPGLNKMMEGKEWSKVDLVIPFRRGRSGKDTENFPKYRPEFTHYILTWRSFYFITGLKTEQMKTCFQMWTEHRNAENMWKGNVWSSKIRQSLNSKDSYASSYCEGRHKCYSHCKETYCSQNIRILKKGFKVEMI